MTAPLPTGSVHCVPITNANQRVATFVAPNYSVANATLFFRLTVNDGFGATVQSTNLSVALANTAPVVPNPPSLRTGLNMSVLNPTNIYIGSQIEIDATSTDPDLAGPLTYEFSGQPCGGLGLPAEAGQVRIRGGRAAQYDFQGDNAIETFLPGAVDDAHSAVAQLFVQLIVAERRRAKSKLRRG